jgi:hypothetical protein
MESLDINSKGTGNVVYQSQSSNCIFLSFYIFRLFPSRQLHSTTALQQCAKQCSPKPRVEENNSTIVATLHISVFKRNKMHVFQLQSSSGFSDPEGVVSSQLSNGGGIPRRFCL